MESPLLYPVKLEDTFIRVLDETLLPNRVHYIKVTSLKDACYCIKEMKTRSLGQVLLCCYSFVLFEQKNSIEEICNQFTDIRPTFDFPMIGVIIKKIISGGAPLKHAVLSFIDSFDKARRTRAFKMASLLPKNAKILTLCNVNGDLILIYNEMIKMIKTACFYVSETRPYLQGTRLTFWELKENKIPTTLICDNQAALLMKEKKINSVVVGADRATTNGDIINKTGTYALACMAKYFEIPFFSLTQYPRNINVDDIEIEERPTEELFIYHNNIGNINAIYPAFDITKSEYITNSVELVVQQQRGGAK